MSIRGRGRRLRIIAKRIAAKEETEQQDEAKVQNKDLEARFKQGNYKVILGS